MVYYAIVHTNSFIDDPAEIDFSSVACKNCKEKALKEAGDFDGGFHAEILDCSINPEYKIECEYCN